MAFKQNPQTPDSPAGENKLATKPMFPLVLSLSLPAMFSMLVQALYNIVDSIFVAWYSESALAAVSLVFPVQSLMIAVAVGTGVGLNSVIARRMGEGRMDRAQSAAAHGIVLGVFNWAAFAVAGFLLAPAFFGLFTDDPEMLAQCVSYGRIVTVFSAGIFVQINIEKVFQATGNMVYPMLFMLVGSIINIILDPIMIFGLLGFPAMGVVGAAVATVIGQMASLAFSLWALYRRNPGLPVRMRGFRLDWQTVRDVYAVGAPSIVMQSIGSVLVAGLNSILAQFGQTAVSVLGVYFKLQSFVFMPVFGLTNGVMPVMGFSYGARNRERLLQALRVGILLAAVIMTAGTLLFWLAPGALMGIFKPSPELLEMGVTALRTISLGFVPAAVGILLSTLFQALGQAGRSLTVSAARQLVVILPVAAFLARYGVGYVWRAFPIAEGVSLVLSLVLFWQLYRTRIAAMDTAPRAAAEEDGAAGDEALGDEAAL